MLFRSVVGLHPGQTQAADADADVEDEPVEAAEPFGGLLDHADDLRLPRDIGLKDQRRVPFPLDKIGGGAGGFPVAVGNGHHGALAREKERHGPTVADRIRLGIQHLLSAADDEDPPPRQAPAARRQALRFGARWSDVGFGVAHHRLPVSSGSLVGDRKRG